MTVMCDVSLYINEKFKVQLEISNQCVKLHGILHTLSSAGLIKKKTRSVGGLTCMRL